MRAVVVDGTSVGAVGTYTFTNVTANHTIAASFERDPAITITAPISGTWARNTTKTVRWNVTFTPIVGSFRVWATPVAGGAARAVSTTVVPVVAAPPQSAYSLSCTMTLPTGNWFLSVYYYDAAGVFKSQNTVQPTITVQ